MARGRRQIELSIITQEFANRLYRLKKLYRLRSCGLLTMSSDTASPLWDERLNLYPVYRTASEFKVSAE
jgi:hypothetical protein